MFDAMETTKLSHDQEPLRDFFYNMLLKTYAEATFDQGKIEHLIKKYTEMRLNECIMKPDLKNKV